MLILARMGYYPPARGWVVTGDGPGRGGHARRAPGGAAAPGSLGLAAAALSPEWGRRALGFAPRLRRHRRRG
jgi:hypothetical protein